MSASAVLRDEEDAQSSLPLHAQQLQRIFAHLRGISTSLSSLSFSCDNGTRTEQHNIQSARIAAHNYRNEREDAVEQLRQRLRDGSISPIDTVYMQPDGVSWVANTTRSRVQETELQFDPSSSKSHNQGCGSSSTDVSLDWSARETCLFKRRYIYRNIPCVIRGLDVKNFAYVTSNWRSYGDGSNTLRINTKWFRQFIGNDALVPVRCTGFDDDENNDDGEEEECLDDEGRAQECHTKFMKLDQWISLIQESYNGVNLTKDNVAPHYKWYLKDWHLLQFLSHQDCSCTNISSTPPAPLYTNPSIFERDILNNFLARSCDDGDYKFVYWGPAGSRTSLHSDVLHSFSWSYNVIGTKKWIFHVPPSNSFERKGETISPDRFEVIQYAGETMFVPSTWKHEVVNLVETISINHNWITPANIDQTWICLQTEIAAIEREIQTWGVIPKEDYEARENMLRGCTGFNCTMFFLMILLEICELCHHLFSVSIYGNSDEEVWDYAYSVFRLGDVLDDVSKQENLAPRLASGFGSETYAIEAMEMAHDVLVFMSKLNNYGYTYTFHSIQMIQTTYFPLDHTFSTRFLVSPSSHEDSNINHKNLHATLRNFWCSRKHTAITDQTYLSS